MIAGVFTRFAVVVRHSRGGSSLDIVLDEKSCLQYLLPPKRDEKITARLRKRRTLNTAEQRQIQIGFITLLGLYPTLSEISSSSFENICILETRIAN